jgi:hypothetical protein
MEELGCWREAERCDRVASQLLRIRRELNGEFVKDISQLATEVESTSRLLRDVHDLFPLYRTRAPVVLYYLTLILPCLCKTSMDMTVYVTNDELLSRRQWILMNERLGEQGGMPLSERFVM